MSVQIIVDSAADMPQKVIEQEKLTVVPLRTIFGNEEYLDGVTITAQQFYEKLIETLITKRNDMLLMSNEQ